MKFIQFCGVIIGIVLCAGFSAEAHSHSEERREISNVDTQLEATYPKLKLVLVNKHNNAQTAGFSLPNTKKILSHKWFNPWKATVIYAFGFTESISSATTQAILDGYVARGDNNIIVIDWSAYNGVNPDEYPVAVINLRTIGGLVGARISSVFEKSLISETHFLGHSLGAHLVAYANRAIPDSHFTKKIPKIIGLDPAGPYFYGPQFDNHPLNPTDARIVQAIHTDMAHAGAPEKVGTIDFYPNGGGLLDVQPGCSPLDTTNQFALTNFCSHQLSVYYYAESLTTRGSNSFAATKCKSYADFVSKKCHRKDQQMGYYAKDHVTGDFYLQTNPISPFNRGLAGITYAAAVSR